MCIYAHTVGNFWWARCDYVRTLPDPPLGCWTCGEMWLLSGLAAWPYNPPNSTDDGLDDAAFDAVEVLAHTGTDHYREPYPKSKWPPLRGDQRLR